MAPRSFHDRLPRDSRAAPRRSAAPRRDSTVHIHQAPAYGPACAPPASGGSASFVLIVVCLALALAIGVGFISGFFSLEQVGAGAPPVPTVMPTRVAPPPPPAPGGSGVVEQAPADAPAPAVVPTVAPAQAEVQLPPQLPPMNAENSGTGGGGGVSCDANWQNCSPAAPVVEAAPVVQAIAPVLPTPAPAPIVQAAEPGWGRGGGTGVTPDKPAESEDGFGGGGGGGKTCDANWTNCR